MFFCGRGSYNVKRSLKKETLIFPDTDRILPFKSYRIGFRIEIRGDLWYKVRAKKNEDKLFFRGHHLF